jgi:hypothetical protein
MLLPLATLLILSRNDSFLYRLAGTERRTVLCGWPGFRHFIYDDLNHDGECADISMYSFFLPLLALWVSSRSCFVACIQPIHKSRHDGRALTNHFPTISGRPTWYILSQPLLLTLVGHAGVWHHPLPPLVLVATPHVGSEFAALGPPSVPCYYHDLSRTATTGLGQTTVTLRWTRQSA